MKEIGKTIRVGLGFMWFWC